ncbi:carbonic anhydrase [Coprinopsis cinerea okayama7|uniref:Carbonic anhydrase n=1 Tax=Coprinopsis cinerea (strain Okayama-7 / 130 / ATCC MYA-4618 / FGSC 9003) TaxID=240176 RepID=A8N2I7_COPC7|nr:carbonic anhydrase [Coprinopsis cinerea okayama7\|eukprot:XP_001829024.1 carbonic anhydrase [Coprinopsis cinerea okayama7\
MPAHESFAANNAAYVAAFDKGHLPLPPAKKYTVVTCMDARIDKEALRSIVISQRLLGTREVAVFHHTDCGMLTFTTPQLQDIVKDAAPGNDAVASAVDKIDFLEISDVEGSVKSDVKFLQENPLVLPETKITGWTYDVRSGKVQQVA